MICPLASIPIAHLSRPLDMYQTGGLPLRLKLLNEQMGLSQRDLVCLSVCCLCSALLVTARQEPSPELLRVPWDPGTHALRVTKCSVIEGLPLGDSHKSWSTRHMDKLLSRSYWHSGVWWG